MGRVWGAISTIVLFGALLTPVLTRHRRRPTLLVIAAGAQLIITTAAGLARGRAGIAAVIVTGVVLAAVDGITRLLGFPTATVFTTTLEITSVATRVSRFANVAKAARSVVLNDAMLPVATWLNGGERLPIS